MAWVAYYYYLVVVGVIRFGLYMLTQVPNPRPHEDCAWAPLPLGLFCSGRSPSRQPSGCGSGQAAATTSYLAPSHHKAMKHYHPLVMDDGIKLASIGEDCGPGRDLLFLQQIKEKQAYPAKLERIGMPCSADISLPGIYSSRHLDQ